jgi:hypothetical protein
MNKSNSGGFKPFAPDIRWRDDGESKFIQIISPAEDIPMVTLHEWIPVGTHKSGKTKYESFMSRKDAGIGENYDDLEDRLGSKPRVRGIGVALELEPVLETVKGRQRPVGFTVQTETFTRRGENGGDETVTAPKIGLITQSSHLFWGWVASFEENNAPIVETPLQVTRRGKETNTRYDFIAFEEKPVDFSNLLDNIEGITYLNGMRDEVMTSIASSKSDLDSAIVVGRAMLEHRLEELGDWDRYKELITPIQELNLRFGGTKPKAAAPAPAAAAVAVEESAPAEAASATKLDAFRKLQQRLDTE